MLKAMRVACDLPGDVAGGTYVGVPARMKAWMKDSSLAALGLLLCFWASPAFADKTLQDYRYFRALSIDLNGRVPTRDEIAAFAADGFDLDAWIDARLGSASYAERVRRVYMDLLRLEVGSAFQYVPGANVLRRVTVKDARGADVYVYFRQGQRRTRPETDATFCLTQAETGLPFPKNTTPTGTPSHVPDDVFDNYTKWVKPWWLYSDYRAAQPSDRYDVHGWPANTSGFTPVAGLLVESDKTTTTMQVRVCAEEASAADSGTIYASGRTSKPVAGSTPAAGRLDFPPQDNAYATANHDKAVSCTGSVAYAMSADCGCGVGLERCLPGDGSGFDPAAFMFPTRTPLGWDQPFDDASQPESAWSRMWWGQEAVQFIDHILLEDRDFREILTGRYGYVNGPLASFYRSLAPTSHPSQALTFGYTEPTPLFDPTQLPRDLLPQQVADWRKVEDRGPQASGILTMPVFLTKYGSRRARAHVLWNAFACKDFIAGNVQLTPSTEPNLMIRPGCQTCHATLEPLAAYFTRIQESSWNFLPPDKLPVSSSKCANADPTKMSAACTTFYDPAFTTKAAATLRGAYASSEHAEAGPAGIAAALTGTSDFALCAAENVASSFLGRPLTSDDDTLKAQLAAAFGSGGYKMRALVKALLLSNTYRTENDLSSSVLRQGAP
jgi:Protein of unknown function (DUF1585)/Protein of unknown function (DUF1549)